MPNTTSSSEQLWNIIRLLTWTTSYFKSHHIDSPRADAEILLAHTLNCRRIDLYLRYDQPLSQDELAIYKALIKRRLGREPVAYIVGQKAFWSFDLTVSPQVLIPRPETECLVELALAQLPEGAAPAPLRVLELGTGTGAIILSLAHERPGHQFIATDVSTHALQIARGNAARYELANKVDFICSDWFGAIKHDQPVIDLIVSNPPYIPTEEIPKLQPEISLHEPPLALDGGRDGLGILKRILQEASCYLRSGGMLFIEIGSNQRKALEGCLEDMTSYACFQFYKDHSDQDRILKAIRK
jgi:release factor glutamine methyltransferase